MQAGSVGSGFASTTANGNSAYDSGFGFGVSAGVFQMSGKGMVIYVPPQ
jgi:hypothetical protein